MKIAEQTIRPAEAEKQESRYYGMKRKWKVHEVLIGAGVPTILYWFIFALVLSLSYKIPYGQALVRWYTLLFLAFTFVYSCYHVKKIIVRQKEEEERKEAEKKEESSRED